MMPLIVMGTTEGPLKPTLPKVLELDILQYCSVVLLSHSDYKTISGEQFLGVAG